MARIALRDGVESDFPLVLDSFWRSFAASHYAHGVPAIWLRRLMLPLLKSWRVTVAVAEDDENEILGFVVYRDNRTIAWVQVKPAYQRRGVAAALLSFVGLRKGEVFCPFLATRLDDGTNFPKLCASKGYTVRFRPYLPFAEEEAKREDSAPAQAA